MQLFILDHDPVSAAGMLCDVHLRKMCLETAQILSAVLLSHGTGLTPGMPRIYSRHHPVILALNTPFKINWCIDHNSALHLEYERRFGKNHAYCMLAREYRTLLFSAGRIEEDWSFCRNFKTLKISEPDIVEAYREYYRFKKTVLRRWSYTNSTEPEWL